MNKRILIPTDFSKNALNAIRYTIDLYAKLNCDFYFLNVFSFDKYTTNNLSIPEEGSAAYEQAKEDCENNFVKLLDTLALHPENLKHNYYIESSYSFLSEAIQKIITEKDIDLVAMGTKGATGSKGVLFGSNTVMAMEKIRECPVLAIPEHVSFMSPKEIVFPTDYKDVYLADQRLWIKTRQAACQSLTNQANTFRNCLKAQTGKRLHQLTDRLTLGIATGSKPQIGRCRMDGCTWFHIVDKRVLGQKNRYDLIEVEYIYGESAHPTGSDYAYPNYPSEYSLEFETNWFGESARTRLYCNPKKPVVISDDEAILLYHVGVHEYMISVWTHACYSAPSLSSHSEQWLEANGIADIGPEEVLPESEKKQFLNWVKSFAKPEN